MSGISARKRIWGWFFFDWASQPYHTLLVTFIFGPFFAGVAAEYFIAQGQAADMAAASAQTLWAWGMALAGLVIAFGAPLMGAFADTTGRTQPWVVVFSVMYVIGAAGLWFTALDGSNLYLMLGLFALGFVGAEYALIFTNAQLPDLGGEDEVGKISGSGFAFGYAGGVLALAIILALFAEQGDGRTIAGLAPGLGLLDAEAREGTRFVGPYTALWYAVFMIPYFRWVRVPRVRRGSGKISEALAMLRHSIANLRHQPSLSAYLGASMLYRDALNGLYTFGGIYAVGVLGWQVTQVGIFGILGALSATICSWIGGKLDARFGPKPVIVATIWVLILVCITVVAMSREAIFGVALPQGSNLPDLIFMACGMVIGGMGGVLQSTSRSLMVRHADPEAPTESFGLYGLSGRATAFIAPILIGVATTMTGSARLGVSPVILLFILGLILLRWVKPQGVRPRETAA